MITLADILDPNTQPAQAEHRLRAAYVSVFRGVGNPTEEDKNIVLTDLALQSGFMTVTDDTITGEQLQRVEGGRKLFGRIMRMSTPTAKEIDGLVRAIAREIAAPQPEDF